MRVPAVHYGGRCPGTDHHLEIGPTAQAVVEAEALKTYLARRRGATSGFVAGHLHGPAAGKMFGVMVCRAKDGGPGVLWAFSGEWLTWEPPPGWVPSCGDLSSYRRERAATEAQVAGLNARIEQLRACPPSRPVRRQIEDLKAERGRLSRELTAKVHAAYRFTNPLGEVLALTDVDPGGAAPPTGMGDCCAPKLLQCAARLGLQPEGMLEFWWGSPSQRYPRVEGAYYGSCREKCYPILGFMLRGVDAARVRPL